MDHWLAIAVAAVFHALLGLGALWFFFRSPPHVDSSTLRLVEHGGYIREAKFEHYLDQDNGYYGN